MTINENVPIGTSVLVSAIDSYIREDREQINLLWDAVVAANCTYTAHEMGAGDFYLEIGEDLESVILETVGLTAAVAVDLMQITKGSSGMIKLIRAGDSNVTVKHSASYISLAGSTDVALSAGQFLALVNIGGDPDTGVNGVWYELFRQTSGGSSSSTYTAVNMTAGQTALTTGTEINNVNIENIGLTADAAVNLTTMLLGEAGNTKVIIALDDDITLIQNSASTTGGSLNMNAPVGVDLAMQTGDIVAFVNIGGDGLLSHGYWRELYRTLKV